MNNTIQVPGGSLYYEVRGSGPVLLLISGGCGDASAHSRLLDYLIDKYPVVTYDRRGYTCSKLHDPAQELRMETESEDIHCLLAALGTGPSYVVGNSIGAVIALDFAASYPEQVRTLVAYEPPANYLTSPKTASEKSSRESIQEILKGKGAEAAMKEFADRVGVKDKDIAEQGTKSANNAKFFIQKEFPMLAKYRFEFDALKAAMTKAHIIIGRGLTAPKDSIGYLGATF
jgi:pimeloyl-ACP methyl ester carboxylesterase